MTHHPDGYDLALSRPHTAAVLAVGIAATLLVTAWGLSGRTWIGQDVPVWPNRLRAVHERIDPNTASAASLRRLPNIGRVRADAVVAYRSQPGRPPFRTADDLQAVRGIGPATVRLIAPYLTLPHTPAR